MRFWRKKQFYSKLLYLTFRCVWSQSHLQKKEQTNCCIRQSHRFINLWNKLTFCSSFWRWLLSTKSSTVRYSFWNNCMYAKKCFMIKRETSGSNTLPSIRYFTTRNIPGVEFHKEKQKIEYEKNVTNIV